MDVFVQCQRINELLLNDKQHEARNELINLLEQHEQKNIAYSPLVNHLIRATGLYPYLDLDTATWSDRFIHEVFKVDVGGAMATLHREQSSLLSSLIDGRSIAVSAPTSFGKSFVIDAFIAIKKPQTVVIIVPTIALTDETRRRLYKKFSGEYKIITTSDVALSEKNIFVFPQERALGYLDQLEQIDLLIVDEFYKASSLYDKERSPSLLKAIIKLGAKAKQKYFLAPNISSIRENVFTKNMEFVELLDFNTVFLEKHEVYKFATNEAAKSAALLDILKSKPTKSLIYAGTYANIEKLSTLLIANTEIAERGLLKNFSEWLGRNYSPNWPLVDLVCRGTGIHTGQLHRSLSQIQVKLFEEHNGLSNILSTSSIIEGVNTSAENVIVWKSKNGTRLLNDFTYKNIIGRGGRMFRHFIGKIYLLDAPPKEEQTQLEIPFPDTILGGLDEDKYKESLTSEQISKIIDYKNEMLSLMGKEAFERMHDGNFFQTNDSEFIRKIAREMKANPTEWNGLAHLNSPDVDKWDRLLYKIINLQPGRWDTKFGHIVAFAKVLSNNWVHSIPELLNRLEEYDIGLDMFFKLERSVAFKLSALLNDVNELQKEILKSGVDIAPFVAKVSHVFLPSAVYQLEEYGLPRMVSKKLHRHGFINFLDEKLDLHSAIHKFLHTGKEAALAVSLLDDFDKYVLEYFYDGISQQ